ncbi:hypothetical protein CYMTET_55437 [Cymbomonas tetramitiformis]|uniref:Tryptophan synthase beta chain-like PALP domain-containing protein n=1 Tax=Cymbomonas tetramitiformis TaxID=36881 RepID=A0AAE0BE45_9CHLO|nr:hypothetical protein CYMTET_55437 [Cymbomonas tetramitiformis]
MFSTASNANLSMKTSSIRGNGLPAKALRTPLRPAPRKALVVSPKAILYENILQTIGKTPVVRVNKLGPEGVNLYAKCEFFNPLSSVKDRLAIAVIEDAERKGTLKPGMTVVEATSGNTGIAVAMVCAQKGYPCVICMAEPFSVERRKVMRMLGAKVIVTPAANKGTGMVAKAEELCEKHGWFLCRQFENDANPAYHANTTGPEILSDFAHTNLDYYVTGYGTGGTFQGVSKCLKNGRPDIKIVLAEPEAAQLVHSGVATERKDTGAPVGSHPAFSPHPIQGWTPDFIPKVLEDGLTLELMDALIPVTGPEAIETAQLMARKEGIFCGISGGATMAVALKVCEMAPKGSTVLAMIPDTAERYLSTPLFASIEADMNEEELEIAKSTPNYQLLPKEEEA